MVQLLSLTSDDTAEAIEAVIRLLHERVSDSAAAEPFIRQFYRYVPPSDLADAEGMYGAAMALWGFLRRRTPGTPRLRAYRPSVDEHGWQSDRAIIEIINDDMPFLVDTVTAVLGTLDMTVEVLIHPILRVRRDASGELLGLLAEDEPGDTAVTTESVMHVEIPGQTDAGVLRRIEIQLLTALADVRAAVTDWRAVIAEAEVALAGLDAAPGDQKEVAQFLAWLIDNHFTFLGYRDHAIAGPKADGQERAVTVGKSLGILHSPDVYIFSQTGLPPEVEAYLTRPSALLIAKTTRRSTVHRSVPMDVIGIKRFDGNGQVIGLHLFVGLFTSNVYTHSATLVPILRQKIERVVALAGFRPTSHDGKALLAILEGLPRDELFQASDEQLFAMSLGILHLQERRRTALFVRPDEFERFISCLVFVPRDRYDTPLRLAIKDILETAFGGATVDFYTQVGDSPLARLHLIVSTTPGAAARVDVEALETRIAEAARAWSDHLFDALAAAKGEPEAYRLVRRYGEAFPGFYHERFSAVAAVTDIDRLEEAAVSGGLSLNLYRTIASGDSDVGFKVYQAGSPVTLSAILPMLENMGFQVIGEVPFEIKPKDAGRQSLWINDFAVRSATGTAINVAAVRAAFHEAFAAVWTGAADNDGFNRLVISVGLSWREVVVLRAYAAYLRQAGFTFSQASIEQTLFANGEAAKLLIALFHARFNPAASGESEGQIETRLAETLDAIASPDADRILRRLGNLVRSTLRTNFYQAGADGLPKPYVSFKIDSRLIDDLPLPRPMVEVWVYSPRVEAVHLRGGKVARGGLRWSDRREDFRTEILGLLKAQMVKNAVIVPVGSKGGFVVKKPPVSGGREAFQAEGIACYKTFMSGLLDITDTLKGAEVVPPADVVRRDGDDPYLVVAADKGTATFSDIANGVAIDYGFWLGDAFASGGSVGYDHKAMGITARGAWEAVKRHFREMGRNIQATPFTTIGIGDMSGDVFGNGMLLSTHTQLVAAFDHRHIFIDPTPDVAASFAERQRLFALPRSSWADYDPALISPGGGVFARTLKSIPLTPEIQRLIGSTATHLTPVDLIRGLLKAEVDLLWFGGIGTYLRASHETDLEVGDRANDPLRVTARDVRAKVVGEGANLGVTQRARIEFASLGGRINTDAIDNSAGVDTSDHEVNLKILLDRLIADGDMTPKQRNALLVEMTEEVGQLVLRDNYLQTQAISLMQTVAPDILDHQQRLMRLLERAGRLDRAIEFLPDPDTIADRLRRHEGLTRPELAVIVAYSKMWLYDEILKSDLPDDPAMVSGLMTYFPEAIQTRFAAAVLSHPLRREIIATHVANSMVNRVGGTFVTQIMERTGCTTADIARAYIVTRESYDLRTLWAEIEALDDHVAAEVQYRMLLEINRLVERVTLWVLRNAPQPLDMAKLTAAFAATVSSLRQGISQGDTLPADVREDIQTRVAAYTAAGVPADLATTVASLIVLASVPDIERLSRDLGQPVATVAGLYMAVGQRFTLGWLRSQGEGLNRVGSHWEKLAATAVIEDLYADQRAVTTRIARAIPGEDAGTAIAAWIDSHRSGVERADLLISELKAAASVDLPMVIVAARHFRALAEAV